MTTINLAEHFCSLDVHEQLKVMNELFSVDYDNHGQVIFYTGTADKEDKRIQAISTVYDMEYDNHGQIVFYTGLIEKESGYYCEI